MPAQRGRCVSVTVDPFPKPNEWVHLSLSWDETQGIRFYVNGKLGGRPEEAVAVYNAGLDQFGPHSGENHQSRGMCKATITLFGGGDLDELRVYDRMLSDENIATLASRADGLGAGALAIAVRSGICRTAELSRRMVAEVWLESSGRSAALLCRDRVDRSES